MAKRIVCEKWRPIPRWDGVYFVSDFGRVMRIKPSKGAAPGTILKCWLSAGYPAVALIDRSGKKTKRVHRLILEAFVGPAPIGHMAHHKDGNRRNSTLANLEWVTRSANVCHWQSRLPSKCRGSRCWR